MKSEKLYVYLHDRLMGHLWLDDENRFKYLRGVILHTVETLDSEMPKLAGTVVEQYNGKATIGRICEVIRTHSSHVRNCLK